MSSYTRRDFITTSAALGAAAFAQSRVRADAANDRICMGIIGLGGRGRDHGRGFAMRDDVYVKWVCDPDMSRIGSFPDQLSRQQDRPVEGVQDMRRIFEDPEVDAVCIATCDHWHGLATVWACQAGKDVYVEKPASHNIWEGRKMVEAARKYDRIVQVGTQNRSAPYIQEVAQFIAEGNAGVVPLVKVYNMKGVMPFRCPEDEPVPDGVDYDLYLGPAPMRPFNRGHFHDGWKEWFLYSGGDTADDGSHQLDIARLLMGDPGAPRAVHGMGGKMAMPDADGDVPDTQIVSFEFDNAIMTFDFTQYTPYMYKTPGEIRDTDQFPSWGTNATKIEVYGAKRKVYVGRHGGGWQAIGGIDEVKEQGYGRQTTREHHEDFIACMRSRKAPNADIEQGHQSSILMHLANISTALGGRRLEFDPETGQITNDPEANAHLLRKRDYREGYVLPEEV